MANQDAPSNDLIALTKESYKDKNLASDKTHYYHYLEAKNNGFCDIVFNITSFADQRTGTKDPRFDCISNDFKIILLDCRYSGNSWSWAAPQDYKVIVDKSIAPILYLQDDSSIASESKYDSYQYLGLMSIADNQKLGTSVTQSIINNTSQSETKLFLKGLLYGCPSPDMA